ncbi:MAG: energy transducer TonB [Chloroflexaceae bacterium]|nr:energy transducer TonB [Chloroflexaceae bacterium]
MDAAGQAIATPSEPAPLLALPENYLALVRARLQQELRFPIAAREQGLSGTAHIRFEIASDGQVSAVTLVRSSGQPSLDREALALPRRVSPLPPPPNGTLQQGRAVLAVPIVFVLR